MSRLNDISALRRLESFIGYHLGEQHHHRINIKEVEGCTEAQRLSFLPHIFGLMPASAAVRGARYVEVKPIIKAHLTVLGLPTEEGLIDIIKDLCDNYDRTKWSDQEPQLRIRKATIGDLRQQKSLYSKIRTRQGARCKICGSQFASGKKEETLDHVIPWRLGGDPPGGWNWQLLCRRCNEAKGSLLSACVTAEYQNWIFDDLARIRTADAAANFISPKGRYLALAHFKKCQHSGCNAGPDQAELVVKKKADSGFAVFDNITVVCMEHAAALNGPILADLAA